MDKNEKIIDFFLNNVKCLREISIEEIKDIINLGTLIMLGDEYEELLKKKAFLLLCQVGIFDILPLRERWMLYYRLHHFSFVNTMYDSCRKHLIKMYERIYFYVESQMPIDTWKEDKKGSEDGPVVIITNQFLSERHAPTRDVLDYAYTIQKSLGIPVYIINEASLHFENEKYFNWTVLFYYLEEYNDYTKIKYKDLEFDFYQIPVNMPDLNIMKLLISEIKSLSPRLIYNVGASCLTADLCKHFATVASVPCATSLPVTMAENMVLRRNLRESDKESLERLWPWQKVIESVVNYIMPQNELCKYTREQLNIPNDAWVIVAAGNRMEMEMDEEFLAMVDQVLSEISDSHFLVVGPIGNTERLLEKFINRERVHLPGSLKDGSEAIRLADVCIQPTRKGGGRAAFEAMYYSVPVVVTMYGDTWDVCGEAFEVSSYEKMKERLEQLYYDKDYYAQMCNISRERALELEDMKGMFEKVFQKLNVKY